MATPAPGAPLKITYGSGARLATGGRLAFKIQYQAGPQDNLNLFERFWG